MYFHNVFCRYRGSAATSVSMYCYKLINNEPLLYARNVRVYIYTLYTYQSHGITNHRAAAPMPRPAIPEDVGDIHKRKQLRERGIDGLHVVAGIFSGNSPFLSLSVVLISREIREAPGFQPASGRKDTKRARARRRKGWTCFPAVETRFFGEIGDRFSTRRTRLPALSPFALRQITSNKWPVLIFHALVSLLF